MVSIVISCNNRPRSNTINHYKRLLLGGVGINSDSESMIGRNLMGQEVREDAQKKECIRQNLKEE